MKRNTLLVMILGLATWVAMYALSPVDRLLKGIAVQMPSEAAGTQAGLGAAQPSASQAGAPFSGGVSQPPGTPASTNLPGTGAPFPTQSPRPEVTGTPFATAGITSTAVISSTPVVTATSQITTTHPVTMTATPRPTTGVSVTPTVSVTLALTPTITNTPLPPIINFQPRETVRSLAPRILQTIVILLIGWLLASLGRRIVNRALIGIHPEVRLFLSKLTFAGVLVAALLYALSVLQVYFATLATILGTVGLAVSLASQDLIKNLVAGVYLLLEHPFGVGDRISIGGYTGEVRLIDLRTTLLHTDEQQDVLVPNTFIMSQVVVKELEVIPAGTGSPAPVQADESQTGSVATGGMEETGSPEEANNTEDKRQPPEKDEQS